MEVMGEEEGEAMEATGKEEDGPLVPEVGLRINCAHNTPLCSTRRFYVEFHHMFF